MDQTTKQVVRAIALALCGLFAYILLELVARDRLKYYLNTAIFGWVVLAAGILLATMVALRAGTWIAARLGMMPDVAHDCCNHDHGHDHSHDHDHEQHAHSHEVSLWRLVIVALPLMMLMAGIVPEALSADAIRGKMSQQQRLAAGMTIASLPPGRTVENAKIRRATMKELAQDARDPVQRAMWESVSDPIVAKVVGQLIRLKGSGRYQLTHMDRTCCAGDATPVVILVAGDPDPKMRDENWLEVMGPVSYQKDPSGGFTPVVHQAEVKATTAPSDLYK